ncbi:hypothetical protein F511_35354 [Dorcoceras hygrometricum]|uniref:Uncharacterized protein n=1 Tax=Dorcoceras hygrometricum TaxID=472368 RepID=A0A2Z7BLT1_9LAMI|nr:hypothetical protein F511_35354 [Dorcoceras hygrometricum]
MKVMMNSEILSDVNSAAQQYVASDLIYSITLMWKISSEMFCNLIKSTLNYDLALQALN